MPIILLSLPFLLLAFISRVGLTIYTASEQQLGITFPIFTQMFVFGFFNDLVTLLYFLVPYTVFSLLTPVRYKKQLFFRLFSRSLYFIWIFLLCFNGAAEYIFWEEFSSRFNFIAVDYLVYTQEVTSNITESYPVPAIIMAVLFISIVFFVFTLPLWKRMEEQTQHFRTRLLQTAVIISLSVLSFFFVNTATTEISTNHYADELGKNGIYNLFAAFNNNHLNYSSFYKTNTTPDIFVRLRQLVKADNETYISTDPRDLSRIVTPKGEEKRHNVILLSVESLSAEFLGQFGPDKTLTPYLNKLGPQGLVFTQYFATGTRTVRGLEAMTLSVPPTPGNSILRRPNNEGLFSIGSVFKAHGYESKFLYGGYGYFDNMNYFFTHNGFTAVDRSDIKEVGFANAWGVADEYLFTQALQEADDSFAQNKPFFSLVMTTSNHRPYTYPADRIDIPSGTGRKGAVKYTDYAIGRFIEQARSKPWFDNTIFVITADHCASSAGKAEIPVPKYHIPLIIYAPKIITPGTVNHLTSQMDLAPTILGLLNFHYTSKFFGSDILYKPKERAMLGTYQKLGYIEPGKLLVLDVGKKVKTFSRNAEGDLSPIDEQEALSKDAISFYQGADYLFLNGMMNFNASPVGKKD